MFLFSATADVRLGTGNFYRKQEECFDCMTYEENPADFLLTSSAIQNEFECSRQVDLNTSYFLIQKTNNLR